MGIAALPNTQNEEDYRREHQWDFPQLSCYTSGVVIRQCLSCVPSCVHIRIQELTIRNRSLANVTVFLIVSACPTASGVAAAENGIIKLGVDIPAMTTRVWGSEPGRKIRAHQRPCFIVTPSCVLPSAVFVTGAGLLE
jgi:hypothetical protein